MNIDKTPTNDVPAGTPLNARSIVFWRHLAGIAIVMMAIPPRLYVNEGTRYFLGLWAGSVFVAYSAAALIIGLAYLFLTSLLSGRVGRGFIVCAWAIAGLQLLGQWFLPSLVAKTNGGQSITERPRVAPPAVADLADATKMEPKPLIVGDGGRYDISNFDRECGLEFQRRYGKGHALKPIPAKEIFSAEVMSANGCATIGASSECINFFGFPSGSKLDGEIEYSVPQNDSMFDRNHNALCNIQAGKVDSVSSGADRSKELNARIKAISGKDISSLSDRCIAEIEKKFSLSGVVLAELGEQFFPAKEKARKAYVLIHGKRYYRNAIGKDGGNMLIYSRKGASLDSYVCYVNIPSNTIIKVQD